eukprot:128355_1
MSCALRTTSNFVVYISPELLHTGKPDRTNYRRRKALRDLSRRKFNTISNAVFDELNTLDDFDETKNSIYLYAELMDGDSMSIRNNAQLTDTIPYLSVEASGTYVDFLTLGGWFEKKRDNRKRALSSTETGPVHILQRLNNGNSQNTNINRNNETFNEQKQDITNSPSIPRTGRKLMQNIHTKINSNQIEGLESLLTIDILNKGLVDMFIIKDAWEATTIYTLLDLGVANCPVCPVQRKLMFVMDVSPVIFHLKRQCKSATAMLMVDRYQYLRTSKKTLTETNVKYPLPTSYSCSQPSSTSLIEQILSGLTESSTILINDNKQNWGYETFCKATLRKQWWTGLHVDTQTRILTHFRSLTNSTNNLMATTEAMNVDSSRSDINSNQVIEQALQSRMFTNGTHFTKYAENIFLLSTP